MSDAVRPGKVDWTGDNPFVYLKTDPEGLWSSLSLFFRVTASDHGPGHLVLTVERPYDESAGDAVRLALTDNEPLARFLIDDFVREFVLFRPAEPALEALELVVGAEFTQSGDGITTITEAARTGDRSLALTWEGLGEPFAVDVPATESGTRRHEMFSVFRIATAARVEANGRRLPGATIERDFLNGPGQSAALALSETWVRDDSASETGR
ncbi:hypothetical protein [Streptomyces arenae]|uniref:hypothetical protein n=1 Tax=Streptomyces arenae TaxID=29301 RepID=UPI0026597517|nr:hypothetical protein [Streptomyces arenae]MCG7205096.1 hypothetical protein [Streptomyces arenae]